MFRSLSTPIGKTILWCFAAVVSELAPIGLVWGIAIENNKPPGLLILEYLGGVAPLVIGLGVLVSAVADVAIDDHSLLPVLRHCLHFILLLVAILWALPVHLISKTVPGPISVAAVIAAAVAALVVSGVEKYHCWRRHQRVA